jgi:cell division transport system permease protein
LTSAKRVAHQPGWLARQLQDHTRAINATLNQLARRPLSTLLTAFVIGITLALPAGLHTLLRNFDFARSGLQDSLSASLFLKDAVSAEQGRALSQALARRAGVASARYISREQALQEFRERAGFGQALDLLKDNPLPAAIVVAPDPRQPQAQADALFKDLAALPEVELAKLDEKWLQRLYGILGLVQRAVLLTAGLLALAVVVVIANTLRLDIENRREEIGVLKLIGATDSFIRRPFLYTGLWYGLTGALLACLLVEAGRRSLGEPVQQLAGLYNSTMTLKSLSFDTMVSVFAAGALLGWAGAWWTVSRHLRHIGP